MTFTLSFDWWLAPLAVTVAAFGWAFIKQDRSYAGGYGAIGQAMGNLMLLGLALIVGLLAWLAWALLA